ncbi:MULTISPECIES: hypothetical protein [unclassified Nostoc]|uniref:hypothetical protein n=1 Tax=unclassified Nostoc TaxID=2593658 RepID=UPI002AD2BEF7|nr:MULTISPECIES: hypothetical protein [unclassified Nostoc]MDZ8123199.1 hypothetical protein [Nostoc sp. CmiVER01]MDZ8224507.1 hypothetical protein [Nostoc sp. ChiVER01]
MHHSLKIKILDLDHIESIVEQDIRDVEAEKIVGGTLSVSASQVSSEISLGATLSVSGSKLVSRLGSEDVMSFAMPSPAEPLLIPLHVPLLSKLDLQFTLIL